MTGAKAHVMRREGASPDSPPAPNAALPADAGLTMSRSTRNARRRRFIRIVQLLIVATFLGWWQHSGSTPLGATLYSSPSDVAAVLYAWTCDSAFWSDLLVTLKEAVLGYVLGAGLAVSLALLLLWSKLLQRLITPFVAAIAAIPKVAMAPLFAVWFGLESNSKIAFVISLTFFMVFWGIAPGLRSIDPIFVQNAWLLGARRLAMLRDVYLPATVGWLMTSLRLCISWALIGATIAEYLGSDKGIGFRVREAQSLFRQDIVIGGILVIAVVALLSDRVLWRVERRFTSWRLA